MTDRGWDDLATVWQNQPVPDIQKIAAKLRSQHRRLILVQANEFLNTFLILVVTCVAFMLTSDAWLRSFMLTLAVYAIVQQYLMVRSAKGLWKRDTESVKDMLEHSARHNRQRIYRLRLRYLEMAVIAIATIPLIWHLSRGSWDGFFANTTPLLFAIMVIIVSLGNLFWVFWRMPRFRRALHEIENMRQALASEEAEE